MNLLEALSQKGLIEPYEVDNLQSRAKTEFRGDIFPVIESKNIDPDQLNEVATEFYGVSLASRMADSIDTSLFRFIPEDVARKYRIIPISKSDNIIELGMVNPHDLDSRNIIQFMFQNTDNTYNITFFPYSEYLKSMEVYGSFGMRRDEEVSTNDSSSSSIQSANQDSESLESLLSHTADITKGDDGGEVIKASAPITKTVASLLKNAIESGVSDIHIEAEEHNTKVRYRLDGQLSTELILPAGQHSAIVARIKVLAKLKLDERRKPQDGRFPARIANRTVDFRVSTMPTFFGEKVVIRILDPEAGVKKLDNTGMSEHHIKTLRKALTMSHGIILVTGPTGSGKTTTLYSMLAEIDKEGKNVISLEDPVEYKMKGVNQSQVHPEIGYTFANGLRSILRQDPDVIMVGEIRDKETARLAIQAALTGHLVLATLHTNSSIGVIPRLVDMGVDPYLIAPTLRLAIAQRLVRKLCPDIARPMKVEAGIKAMIDNQLKDLDPKFHSQLKLTDTVYEPGKSETCPNGLRGRIGVYEMYNVDTGLEKIILTDSTEPTIYKYIRERGFTTMKEDAISKSMQKIIGFNDTNTL